MPYRHAYERVIDDITGDIGSGTLRPGDKLPSARELASQYGVSLMVIRTAMTILRDRGLVYPVSGVGVFVADNPPGAST